MTIRPNKEALKIIDKIKKANKIEDFCKFIYDLLELGFLKDGNKNFIFNERDEKRYSQSWKYLNKNKNDLWDGIIWIDYIFNGFVNIEKKDPSFCFIKTIKSNHVIQYKDIIIKFIYENNQGDGTIPAHLQIERIKNIIKEE